MPQRSFLKDISGVFAGNILALVFSFSIDIVLSRQLGPEGRGLYTAILVVPMIISSFVMLGIRRSAVFHLGKGVYDDNRTVSGVISLLILTSIAAVVASGLALLITQPDGITPAMGLLALLSIPVKLALIYSGGIYIGKENFRRSNLQVWLPLLYNFLGIILFVVFIKWWVTGALLAMLLSNVLVASVSLSYLYKNFAIRIRWDKEVVISLMKVGVVYAIAVVVMQLNYRIDIILLQKLSSMREVGYYSLGVAISDKLWQLPSAMGLVVMSRTANATDLQVLNRDVARLVRVAFIVVLVVSVLLWVVAPVIIPLLFGAKFAPSVHIVRLMLPGIIMFVVVRILSGRFAGSGEPLLLIGLFVPTLIVNIILNLFWIPRYGGLGAAMATNVSYSLGAVGMLVMFSIRMHIPFLQIIMPLKSDFAFVFKFFKRQRNR